MMSSAYPRSRRVTVRRKALMLSCATLAMATAALAPQKAQAQAFNGTMTPTPGATQTITGPGTETITVNSGMATINWAPDESGAGNIVFLPTANTATFQGDTGLLTYTVLNRVVPSTDPTRAIELNGTVLAKLDGGATGGNVWFYSPGGIVVGADAYFDVGGLLLSTIDVTDGWTADGNGFSASFAKTQTAAGAIRISPDAQIDALQQNSYVALVAPRIEQGGNVQVSGAAAYVAGEQLSLTMNQGLFDIFVDVGTDDLNGVVHSGITGGPAASGNGYNHSVYMVAVPKNQAMTMLLGGDVGFAPATVAGVENGQIFLSSGWNVHNSAGGLGFSGTDGLQAGMQFGAGNYSSDLRAYAQGDITAIADTGSITFGGDLYFGSWWGGGSSNVELGAVNGNLLSVAGEAFLYNDGAAVASGITVFADSGGELTIGGDAVLFSVAAADGTTGWVDLLAYGGGSVTVAGYTSIYTNVGAQTPSPDLPSADAYAGDVRLDAWGTGSSITLAGVTIEASADGQDNIGNGDGSAGDAYGGDVSINASGSATITMASLYASVDGRGGDMLDGGLAGGDGHGGSIVIGVGDGDVWVSGDTFLSALGIGGSYTGEGTPGSATGGTGYGGWSEAYLWGPGSFSVGGNTTLRADGIGGVGQTGGAGYGGSAGITAYDGFVDLGAWTDITAGGYGGNASFGYGGNGGLGEGGVGYIEARGNEGNVEVPASTSTITGGDVHILASGHGGTGGASNGDNIAAGSGGAGSGGLYTGELGTGGAFAASSNGSTLQLGNVTLDTQGWGGAGGAGAGIMGGGAGGDAFGGDATGGNYGPIGTASSASYGNLWLSASAHGGDGGTGGTGQGVGGDATAGGFIYDDSQQPWGGAFLNAVGTVTSGTVELLADAFGGNGSIGGDALGGVAQAVSWYDTGSSLDMAGNVWISSYAEGGDGDIGGNATGGYAGLGAIGGTTGATLHAGGYTTLTSDAVGGAGVASGGSGTGGESEIVADAGTITAQHIDAVAQGTGGYGVNFGGLGTGGTVAVDVTPDGSIEAWRMWMVASGYGGGSDSGVAGDGVGGVFTSSIQGSVVALGSFIAFADGVGGNSISGEAGSGYGGAADLTIDGGSLDVTWSTAVTGDGIGGTGGSGGNGEGGTATVLITANGGSLSSSVLETHGFAWGGNSTGGGAAGDAIGGTTLFDVAATLNTGATASVTVEDLWVLATAEAGSATGTAGGAGGAATGGDVTVNFGAATVTIADSANVSAAATGGIGGSGATGGAGGDATGGTAVIDTGTGIFTAASLMTDADATGGAGGTGTSGAGGAGGAGQGGAAQLAIAGGGAITTNDLIIGADGFGGAGGDGATGAAGGLGTGGSTSLSVGDGTFTPGAITANVRGVGGQGGAGTDGVGGSGGAGQGGSNTFAVGGSGIVNASSYLARANGLAGAGGTGTSGSGAGGSAQGGSHQVTVDGTANFTGGFVATSFAFGGVGSIGGSANGGTSSIVINGSMTTGGTLQATGQAEGGAGTGGAGGNADAGAASITINGDVTAGSIFVGANATGGAGTTSGGTASGGDATLRANAGTTQVTDWTLVSATGTGGTGAEGGDAVGGAAELLVDGAGYATLNAVTLDANATGGTGSATGGDATGGAAAVQSLGELDLAGTLMVKASGFGGGGLIDGNGAGGLVGLYALSGGTATIYSASLRADGTGGSSAGGDGGDGTGGTAELIASGTGSSISIVNETPDMPSEGTPDLLSASGYGGQNNGGGDLIGGTGTGGQATARADTGASVTLPLVTDVFGFNRILARGTGGNAAAEGGVGGLGVGGQIDIGVDNATMVAPNLLPSVFGQGGSSASPTLNITGGDGIGGTRNIYATNAGTLTIGANGGTAGGLGGAGSGTGNGGSGSGGLATLTVDGGTVELSGRVIILAQSFGGDGAVGGDATGAVATIDVLNGGVITSLNPAAELAVGGVVLGGQGVTQGGDAFGSSATLNISADSAVDLAGNVLILANGTAGGGDSGGQGSGGTATLNADGSLTAGEVQLTAQGFGGQGVSAGGDAFGGNAQLTVGGVAELGATSVNASATGGTATSGTGGTGWAGEAIATDQGTWSSSGDVFVSADGEGGGGAAGGGDGHGGSAAVRIQGGTADLSGSLTVSAAGTGGTSANGTGGDGYGNYARMSAYEGGVITANNVTIDSSGQGGDGIDGGNGFAQPSIEGWGGSVLQSVEAGASMTLTGSTVVTSNGVGGTATTGIGGDGTGGFASIGGLGSPLTFESALLQANGTGVGGGVGTGGTTRLVAEAGSVVGGSAVLESNGTLEGGTVRLMSVSGGDVQLSSLAATANGGSFAGDVLVEVDDTSVADFGTAELTSVGSVPGSDEDGIEVDVAGQLNATSLTLTSSDDVLIATALGGQILVNGTIDANSAGLVRLLDDGNGGLVEAHVLDLDGADVAATGNVDAFDIFITVDGDYSIGYLLAAENGLSITAGGGIVAAESVFYGASLTLDAGTSLSLGDMFIEGSLGLTAAQNIEAGNLTATGSVTANAGGSILAGDVNAGDGVAAGAGTTLTLGDVTTGYVPPSTFTTLAVAASGDDVVLNSGGNMVVENVNSAGGITLNAGGTMTTGDLDAATSIAATSAQTMEVLSAGAGQDVALTSGTDLLVGNVDAGGSAAFTAGGLASFFAAVAAPTITVTSGGLFIDDEAALGQFGLTSLITFNAVSSGPIIIGGDGSSSSGYQLAAEGDINSEAVVVNAVAGNDVVLRDLEIEGSATSGGGVASVTLNTGGSVFVEGAVDYVNAGNGDLLAINAGRAIEVITDGGSIAMTDSAGNLAGTLSLTADNVWVADQAIVDQLETNLNFAGRDEALGTNNGTVNPEGYVQAGAIIANVADSLVVQNSGTAEEPAGISVGDGGMAINSTGSSPATVVLYGRQVNSDGTIVGGQDFVEGVDLSGSGGFTDDSSVNGCGLNGCLPDAPPFTGGSESILGPIGMISSTSGDGAPQDGDEDEDEEGDDEGSSVDPAGSLINTGPLQNQTTVDEPITSGSDSPGGQI